MVTTIMITMHDGEDNKDDDDDSSCELSFFNKDGQGSFALFLFINVKHNFINKNQKFEIIASPVYYILLLISTIWFSYVLLVTLDPNF